MDHSKFWHYLLFDNNFDFEYLKISVGHIKEKICAKDVSRFDFTRWSGICFVRLFSSCSVRLWINVSKFIELDIIHHKRKQWQKRAPVKILKYLRLQKRSIAMAHNLSDQILSPLDLKLYFLQFSKSIRMWTVCKLIPLCQYIWSIPLFAVSPPILSLTSGVPNYFCTEPRLSYK